MEGLFEETVKLKNIPNSRQEDILTSTVNSCSLDYIARRLYSEQNIKMLISMQLQDKCSVVFYGASIAINIHKLPSYVRTRPSLHIFFLKNESIVAFQRIQTQLGQKIIIICESSSVFKNIKKWHVEFSDIDVKPFYYVTAGLGNRLSSMSCRGMLVEKLKSLLKLPNLLGYPPHLILRNHQQHLLEKNLVKLEDKPLTVIIHHLRTTNTGANVYKVSINKENYALRILNMEQCSNEKTKETRTVNAVSVSGLAPPVISTEEQGEFYIVKFIAGLSDKKLPISNINFLTQLADRIKLLHASKLLFDPRKNPNIERLAHLSLLNKHHIPVPKQFNVLQKSFLQIYNLLNIPADYVPSHFDLHRGNIIYSNNNVALIDWEYAGIGSRYLDLVILVMCLQLTPSQTEMLLKSYFGAHYTLANYAKLELTRMVGLFLVSGYEFLHAFYYLIPCPRKHNLDLKQHFYDHAKLTEYYNNLTVQSKGYDRNNLVLVDIQCYALFLLKEFEKYCQAPETIEYMRIIRCERLTNRPMTHLLIKNASLWNNNEQNNPVVDIETRYIDYGY